MKRLQHFAAVFAIVATAACADRNDIDLRDDADRTDTAVGTSGDLLRDSDAQSAQDTRTFVEDMAHAGNAEVQLGKLANDRASNAQVKEFAQMMVRDHSKANDELKQAATTMNISLPTELDEKHRDLSDRLSKLRGAEFDREYINAMVEGHQNVVNKLAQYTGSGLARSDTAHGDTTPDATPGTATRNDPGDRPAATSGDINHPEGTSGTAGDPDASHVKEWASNTLPTVRQHLDRAKQIRQQLGGTATGTSGTQQQEQPERRQPGY